VSTITIAVFGLTVLIDPGAVRAETLLREASTQINANKITISPQYASIQEKFEGEKEKLVIAIQDAHGIYDAQKNIKAVIEELQNEYGFVLVALEGGAGKGDYTLFRTFPDKEVAQKQVDKYMRRAELTGGEAAAILNPKEGVFYGVEDPTLYFENRNSFLKALDYKISNLHTLLLIKRKLDKIRDEIYPKKLKDFHKKEWEYKNERISLVEFLEALENEGKPVALEEKYPNLSLIFEVKGIRAENLTKEELKEKEKKLLSEVETKKLFDEIKMFSEEIKQSVIVNEAKQSHVEDVKTLTAFYGRLEILKNLSALQITHDDYNYYLEHEDEFKFLNFIEFLDKYQDSINLKLRLGPAKAFYRDAVKRDGALYKNLIKAMDEEGVDKAIIVAGGFHTSGIKDRLESDNFSYIITSPHIDRIPEENPYFKVIQGQLSYKRRKNSYIQSIIVTLGLASKATAEDFLNAYFEGGLRAVARKLQNPKALQEEGAEWQKNIIQAVKARSAVEDPTELLKFVKDTMKETLKRSTQAGFVESVLNDLENAFKMTLSPVARGEVNKFIEIARELKDKLTLDVLDGIFKLLQVEGLGSEEIVFMIDEGILDQAFAAQDIQETVLAQKAPADVVFLSQLVEPEAITAFTKLFSKSVITPASAASLGEVYEPVITEYGFSPYNKTLSLEDVESGVLGVDVGKIHEFGSDRAILDHEDDLEKWPSAAGMMVDPGVVSNILNLYREQGVAKLITHYEQDVDSPVTMFLANEIIKLNGELSESHHEMASYIDAMYGKVYSIVDGRLQINRDIIAPGSLWDLIEKSYGDEELNSPETLKEAFNLLNRTLKLRSENPDVPAEEFFDNFSQYDRKHPAEGFVLRVFGNLDEIKDQLKSVFFQGASLGAEDQRLIQALVETNDWRLTEADTDNFEWWQFKIKFPDGRHLNLKINKEGSAELLDSDGIIQVPPIDTLGIIDAMSRVPVNEVERVKREQDYKPALPLDAFLKEASQEPYKEYEWLRDLGYYEDWGEPLGSNQTTDPIILAPGEKLRIKAGHSIIDIDRQNGGIAVTSVDFYEAISDQEGLRGLIVGTGVGENILTSSDPRIAQEQFKVEYSNGRIQITDLGSGIPTYARVVAASLGVEDMQLIKTLIDTDNWVLTQADTDNFDWWQFQIEFPNKKRLNLKISKNGKVELVDLRGDVTVVTSEVSTLNASRVIDVIAQVSEDRIQKVKKEQQYAPAVPVSKFLHSAHQNAYQDYRRLRDAGYYEDWGKPLEPNQVTDMFILEPGQTLKIKAGKVVTEIDRRSDSVAIGGDVFFKTIFDQEGSGELIVGSRAGKNMLTASDPTLAPEQFKIEYSNGRIQITDLGSGIPTYVRAIGLSTATKKIADRKLSLAGRIQPIMIGETIINFLNVEDEPYAVTLIVGGKKYQLEAGRDYSVGRSANNSILIDDRRASRHHAVISYQPDGSILWIENPASANKSIVNRKKITREDRLIVLRNPVLEKTDPKVVQEYVETIRERWKRHVESKATRIFLSDAPEVLDTVTPSLLAEILATLEAENDPAKLIFQLMGTFGTIAGLSPHSEDLELLNQLLAFVAVIQSHIASAKENYPERYKKWYSAHVIGTEGLESRLKEDFLSAKENKEDGLFPVTPSAKGRSLGDEALQYLASNLLLKKPIALSQQEIEGLTTQLKDPEVTDRLNADLFNYIMETMIPEIFENKINGLKLLAQSVELLSPGALKQHVDERVVDLLKTLRFPERVREKIREVLTVQFFGTLQGVSLEVVQAKLEGEQKAKEGALELFTDNTRTDEDKRFMVSAIQKISENLTDLVQSMKANQIKTVVATTVESLPREKKDLKKVFESYFGAVPLDFLNRPLLELVAFYTANERDRAKAVQDFVKTLRQTEPAIANQIKIKSKTHEGLVSAFQSLLRQQEKTGENLIFVVPDIRTVENLASANVLLHDEENVPPELIFTNGILSQVAVGLASAMNPKTEAAERKRYIKTLKEQYGISVNRDEENNRFIFSFNLQKFIELLVTLKQAEEAIAVAA